MKQPSFNTFPPSSIKPRTVNLAAIAQVQTNPTHGSHLKTDNFWFNHLIEEVEYYASSRFIRFGREE
jgi:hypothetical protein